MNLLNSFHFPLAYEGWDCIISLPFLPFSHLSTSLPPAPPPKKKLWPPDWMKWKFLGLTLKTLYNQHVFDLSPMVLFVHFLSGPQGCFGPQQSCVFTSLPLLWLLARMPILLSSLPDKPLSFPQDPNEMLPVSIYLSALFSYTLYLPHFSPYT